MKKYPWLPLALAGLSMLGTLYASYTHTDKDNAQRLTALESHRSDDSSRLDRIEDKLDKLVYYLTGSKP